MPRWGLYAAILALSALAHLKGITAPVIDYHSHRQANTASIARNFYRHSLPPWAPRVDWEGGGPERAATELPLYMWLAGLLWPVLGLGEAWGRLLSAACSAATAVLLFELLERRSRGPGGRETGWLETEPAFLAGLAFSVLPVEVYFGRTVQPEALALLATVASFWAMDRHLATEGRAAWGWLAATTAASVVAIGHKLPYAYLLGVLGLLGLSRRGWRAALDLRLWIVPLVTTGLVFAWYHYASTGGAYAVPTTKDASLFRSIMSYERLPYFAFFQIFSRLPELALTYPGLVLFGFGATRLLRAERRWFLGGWWACVLIGILAGGGYSHYHDYTALPWAPVNATFIGAGLWSLWRRAPSPAWLKPALVALALGIPLHAALRIHHWYRWTRPELLNAQPIVNGLSGADDLFLCNERASSLALFYIDRRGWSWDLAELGVPGLERVEDAIGRGARYFLTYKDGIFLDPAHPVSGWFFKRFPVVFDNGRFLVFRLER